MLYLNKKRLFICNYFTDLLSIKCEQLYSVNFFKYKQFYQHQKFRNYYLNLKLKYYFPFKNHFNSPIFFAHISKVTFKFINFVENNLSLTANDKIKSVIYKTCYITKTCKLIKIFFKYIFKIELFKTFLF